MITEGIRILSVIKIEFLKSKILSASTKFWKVNVFGIQITVGSRRSIGSRNAFDNKKSTGYRRTYDIPIKNNVRRIDVIIFSVLSAAFFCLSSFIIFSLVKRLVACTIEDKVYEHDDYHDYCKIHD